MIRAVVLVFAFTGCKPRIVELGKADAATDATIDATATIDASTCRCRITPCRVDGDCAVIGGACGADLYCVGDFGPCSLDAQCQATATASVCTRGAMSTVGCH
jgi:hypothetical protein